MALSDYWTKQTNQPVKPMDTPELKMPDLKTAVETTDFLIAQENLREAKANADIAAAILLQTQTSMRPSRNFPISLKHDGIQWVCRFVNGDDDPRNDLFGGGESPEAALVNFDMQWYGIQKE